MRIAGVLVPASSAVIASPQDFDFGAFGPRGRFHVRPNCAYDGRFTFVRVNYETAPGGYWYRGWPAWAIRWPNRISCGS